MKVTWSCFLHDFSSMGIIAINVIKELTKLGVDVGFNVLNINEIKDLSKYPPEVQKAIQKGLREDSINIFFSYPDIYGSSRCKVNVGYTGADTHGWYRTNAPPPAQLCNELMDYILTPSDYSKKIMEKNGVFIPIHIFPHGVNTDIFKFKKKSKSEPFTYLYIGEISRRKGSIELLEVFDRAFKDEKYKLILRANTHMKYYDGELLEKKYKGKNIEIYYQDVGQEDIAKFYDQAHVYVYPARADWFGMTPFEALTCGLPTIATSSNGYYEFLSDAIIPVSYDLKEFTQFDHPYFRGTWNVAQQEHLQKQMEYAYTYYDQIVDELESKNIFNKVRQEYTWKNVTEKYLLPFLEDVWKTHFEYSRTAVEKEITEIEEPEHLVIEDLKKKAETYFKTHTKEEVLEDLKKSGFVEQPRVTIGIPTKDRPVELSLLLYSLLYQTYKNFEVLIINDCFTPVFETQTTLRAVMKLLTDRGNIVTIIQGERKGPHIGGQKILENAKTELILRLDDDVTLEPTCLEEMVKVFVNHKGEKELGAVGPIYLNPHEDLKKQNLYHMKMEDVLEHGKVRWIENTLFLTGVLNVNLLPTKDPIPVEHLNSGFMYRKSAGEKIGGYCLLFSIAGHREESDFSYRIFKEGYDLRICPTAISFHFHPMYGGIRETQGNYHQKQNWDHDEKIFLERIEKILPRDKTGQHVTVVTLTHGKDHTGLRNLLNDIRTYTNHPFHLVLVNNDSDPEAEADCLKIKEEFKEIDMSLISFSKEVSVSEARNEGVRNRDPNSKYLCFVDDDARILGRYNQTTDFLDRLCNLFNEEVDIGAVSPIFTWFDPLKCHCVSVACMFTSVKVWETVGGFDPVFGNLKEGTFGWEDTDWSYRCESLGFKLRGLVVQTFHFIITGLTNEAKRNVC